MAEFSNGGSPGGGEPGAPGEDGDFIYIGFASDDAGADFSLTDSVNLGYFAILRSETDLGTPVVGDFASVVWYSRRGIDGAAGATILNGSSDPVGGTGSDNDFYINTTSWQIFGPKSDGVWGSGSNIRGAQGVDGEPGDPGAQGDPGADGATIHYGAGAPANGTGDNGDSYLDTTNKVFYPNKTAGVWGAGFSMIGPAVDGVDGTNGSTILYGSGAPLNGQGANGDSYLDTTGMVFYANKTAGTWPSGVNLVGGTGATGPQGNAAGVPMLFGASTGNADPTAGKIRFDSAAPLASITTMRINKIDNVGGDRSTLIEACRTNDIIDIQSQSNSGTTFMRLRVTGTIPAVIASSYYNIPVTWINGALPTSNEPIAIRFQPGANMTYNSTTKDITDSSGVVISNPLTYSNLAAAYVDGAAALSGKAFIAVNPSGVNGSPAAFYSDGTDIKALGGEYIYDRLVGLQPKIIWPNTGLTWTASNNGGKVRITTVAAAAHGLTTTPAVGCYLSMTNSPANWPVGAGSLHKITAIASGFDITTPLASVMSFVVEL